jgi:hypothetical protein
MPANSSVQVSIQEKLGRQQRLPRLALESFEAIAREWHAKFSPGWVPNHGDRILAAARK